MDQHHDNTASVQVQTSTAGSYNLNRSVVRWGISSNHRNMQTTSQRCINITINLDQYPADTSWTIEVHDESSNSTVAVATSPIYNDSMAMTLQYEITCLAAPGNYSFRIFDDYEDGICCDWGAGNYTVSTTSFMPSTVDSSGGIGGIDGIGGIGDVQEVLASGGAWTGPNETTTFTLMGELVQAPLTNDESTLQPSDALSLQPSNVPTLQPSEAPSLQPSVETSSPSLQPTMMMYIAEPAERITHTTQVNIYLTGVPTNQNMTIAQQKVFETLFYTVLQSRLEIVDVDVLEVVVDKQVNDPEFNVASSPFDSNNNAGDGSNGKSDDLLSTLQLITIITFTYTEPKPEGWRDWSIYLTRWIESAGPTVVTICTDPKQELYPNEPFLNSISDVSATNVVPPNTDPTMLPTTAPTYLGAPEYKKPLVTGLASVGVIMVVLFFGGALWWKYRKLKMSRTHNNSNNSRSNVVPEKEEHEKDDDEEDEEWDVLPTPRNNGPNAGGSLRSPTGKFAKYVLGAGTTTTTAAAAARNHDGQPIICCPDDLIESAPESEFETELEVDDRNKEWATMMGCLRDYKQHNNGDVNNIPAGPLRSWLERQFRNNFSNNLSSADVEELQVLGVVFPTKKMDSSNLDNDDESNNEDVHDDAEDDGGVDDSNDYDEGDGDEGESEENAPIETIPTVFEKKTPTPRKEPLEVAAAVPNEVQDDFAQYDEIVAAVMSNNPNLTQVVLDNKRQIGNNDGGEALWQALTRNSYVKVLSLRNSNITDEQMAALALALYENTSICTLSLQNNIFTSEGVEYLVVCLEYNSAIKAVELDGNSTMIHPRILDELQGILQSRGGHIDDASSDHVHKIESLLERIRGKEPNLTELNLHGMGIGTNDTKAIMDALVGNVYIRKVDLSSNMIDDHGVSALSLALAEDTSITHLCLADNRITSIGAEYLLCALDTNDTIVDVDLAGNYSIAAEVIAELNHALEQRRTAGC